MSLSEQLARAARRRAGEPDDGKDGRPVEAAVTVEITVILPPVGPVVAAMPDPSVKDGSSCPVCGRSGEPALIDLPRQTTDFQCATCGTLWRARQLVARPTVSRSRSLQPPMR